VGTFREDLTVLQEVDPVEVDDRTDPLGDIDRRRPVDKSRDRRLNPALGRRVERTRAVVED
jgi:hypothetical protein